MRKSAVFRTQTPNPRARQTARMTNCQTPLFHWAHAR